MIIKPFDKPPQRLTTRDPAYELARQVAPPEHIDRVFEGFLESGYDPHDSTPWDRQLAAFITRLRLRGSIRA